MIAGTGDRARGAVLVTGTDTGIGAVCVTELERLGLRVFAGVLEDREKTSDRVTPVLMDVTNPEQIAGAVRTVEAAVGDDGLVGIVNNAGFAIGGPLEFLPLDALRRQLEVNLIGQVAITQAFLHLVRRGRGRIVNIGSPSGTLVLPFLSPYAMSKAGVKAMTEALRLELRPWGIPVSLIEPGRTLTDIWRQSVDDSRAMFEGSSETMLTRYGATMQALAKLTTSAAKSGYPPERVAKTVVRALTSRRPRARYLVGSDAVLLTLLAHLTPTRARDWVIAYLIKRLTTTPPGDA